MNGIARTARSRAFLLFGVALALGSLLTLAGFKLVGAAGGGDIVAVVNGEPLTKDEFLSRLEREAGEQVLDRLISEMVIAQSGVPVSDDEIASELSQIQESYPSREAYLEELARYGLTEERLKEEIHLNLILKKLTREGIEVTDEEIAEFFEENREALGTPARVLVRHILVETKEEAEAIVKELKEGADFEELAREKSIDTESGEEGGLIGYITEDAPIVTSFRDAAFELDEGEVSDPVATPFGWHVIRVDERKEAEEATLESSREIIREILLTEKARPVGEVIAELRTAAKVEVRWPQYEAFANEPAPARAEGESEGDAEGASSTSGAGLGS